MLRGDRLRAYLRLRDRLRVGRELPVQRRLQLERAALPVRLERGALHVQHALVALRVGAGLLDFDGELLGLHHRRHELRGR